MSAPLGRLSESEKGDITALLEKTRFTRDELLDFYKYSKGPPLVDGTLDKEHYVSLCDAYGLSGRSLQSRLWDVLDVSDDGSVTIQELILVLNSLTRGKLEDVTQVFFNIYDVNHDGSIDIEELMEVYADLIEVGKGIKATSLNDAQKERLQKFVNEADANSDQDLDYAEFAAAVKKLSTIDHEKPSLLSARTVLLVIITSFFELGTSFAQAAMGALARPWPRDWHVWVPYLL
jgi:Ca2+-binding EF-hand superfamily protein